MGKENCTNPCNKHCKNIEKEIEVIHEYKKKDLGEEASKYLHTFCHLQLENNDEERVSEDEA